MYYDLLARIKNAARAKKESLQMPFSKFDFEVARILQEAGFLHDVQKRSVNKKNFIEVKLRYKDERPALSDFRIMSTPGRRSYVGYHDVKPVRQHYGIAVLSTPLGIMTGKQARKSKVGGEYLFEAW